MASMIRISKVVGNTVEPFARLDCSASDAQRIFDYIENAYRSANRYDDYLVDLYHNDDLIETFTTTEEYANEIKNQSFTKTG